MRACGTADFFDGLVHQIAYASSNGEHSDEFGIRFMMAFVKGVEPRDHIEAMLIAQMAACHTAAMRSANRLAHAETPEEQESAERAFNKLMRTFAALVEALQRYRAGNEAKVFVQNVLVSNRGVGNVIAPGMNRARRNAVAQRRHWQMRSNLRWRSLANRSVLQFCCGVGKKRMTADHP